MSTKKAISTSFVAIFILIITQIIAQSIASMFVIIKIPTGICNIIAGIIYAGLTYLILKMFISKIPRFLASQPQESKEEQDDKHEPTDTSSTGLGLS